MLFTAHTIEEIDTWLEEIKDNNFDNLPAEYMDELISIATAQKNNKKSKDITYLSENDLRFATNELAAEWRAKRLASARLLEVGCGIGIQTIAFSKVCKKVISVDIDERKIEYAKANLKKLGITNVEFVCADIMKLTDELKLFNPETVFLDPERPATEETRTLKNFSPPLKEFIEAFKYAKIAIELPPQMQVMPADGEREYLSIDSLMNRLTLYLGDNKTSAVLLPKKLHVEGQPKEPEQTERLETYITVPDPAVIKAGLINDIHIREYHGVYTSKNAIKDYGVAYKILGTGNEETIIGLLRELKAGTVLVRWKVDPKDYWKIRKKFEDKLTGTTQFHLFKAGMEYICTKKVNI